MRKRLSAALMTGLLLTSVKTALAEDASCATIKAADLGWTDIALTTETATIVLNAMNYSMKSSLLGLSVTYASLKDGQTDVFLGNWRPAQNTEFKEFFDKKWVDVLTTNLSGAKYTLAVPDYVAAAGVKSFDDLSRFADKFGKKIYGIEPGTNQPLLDMIAKGSHGLSGWTIVESSEQAMLAQVKRAVERKEWIVFLGWQPHPMNLNLKMDYLSGGDEEFRTRFWWLVCLDTDTSGLCCQLLQRCSILQESGVFRRSGKRGNEVNARRRRDRRRGGNGHDPQKSAKPGQMAGRSNHA